MPVLPGTAVSSTAGDAVGIPGRSGVAVRLVDLARDDGAVARAERRLTPDEVARARRGTPTVQRRRVLLRAALRTALAVELGADPGSVPLATTPAGRPYVPGGRGLDVSCSASGSLGLVAVSRAGRVGIDIERVAPWAPAVLDEGWLGPIEQAALLALPPEDRPAAVIRAWTQKEAVLKGRGTGLPGGLAATETPIGRTAGRIAAWELRDVPVPEGWVASLALAADDRPQETPS